ncbi:hypothetical protein GQ53DRAFT_345009 [Thozetella sp. PMI_491]|nr:hypothetical protein GQ53DRAFT_345009 [Thozetella sp. PMI_491]
MVLVIWWILHPLKPVGGSCGAALSLVLLLFSLSAATPFGKHGRVGLPRCKTELTRSRDPPDPSTTDRPWAVSSGLRMLSRFRVGRDGAAPEEGPAFARRTPAARRALRLE